MLEKDHTYTANEQNAALWICLNIFPETISFTTEILGRTPPIGFNEEGLDL